MLKKLVKDILTSKPAAQKSDEIAPPSLPDPPPKNGGEILRQRGGAVIWFSCKSQGDALTSITRDLIAPLGAHASEILPIDVGHPDWLNELDKALKKPVWFAAGFLEAGQHISTTTVAGPANLWEATRIPFIRFYGDIPAYYPDRHVRRYQNSINAYFHRSHADFYRRWFNDQALSVLLPPILLDCTPLEEIDFSKKLAGKILFPKNGNPPVELRQYWLSALPNTISQILLAASEELSSLEKLDQEPGIDNLLCALFSERGIEISAEPGLLCFLVAQIDDYLRRVKSTLIAESLLDLPIIVRGASWNHVSFDGKRAAYDPDCDYASTRALIDGAPAIIDMSPNTTGAPHDRVLRAIGRGAAFLTNENEILSQHIHHLHCTFKFKRDSIIELVEHYATHPQQALDLGIEQARALRNIFSPEKYVESLITAIDTMSLRLGACPQGTQRFVSFPPQLIR